MFVILLIFLVLTVTYFASGSESYSLNEQSRSSAPGQFAELSNGSVHYEYTESEGKPAVVLVHGFSVPYYVWDPTVDVILKAGFSVLRYDLYGRGYSDRPQIEYDLVLYIKQLHDLINDLKLDGPIHLVGLSQGAPIVAAYANRYPDRIASIALIDPLIIPVETKDIFPLNLPLVGEFIARVVLIPYILPGSQVNDFHHPEDFPDWEEKYRVQIQYKGFRRAILSSIRNLVEIQPLDEYKAAAEHDIPFLLIWGREDQTIPYSDIEVFLEVIPAAEINIIEQAGHLPHYERPGIVNPILLEYLKGLSSEGNSN
jgi:pimeloyl-ACP methyl ester carboxylesterase